MVTRATRLTTIVILKGATFQSTGYYSSKGIPNCFHKTAELLLFGTKIPESLRSGHGFCGFCQTFSERLYMSEEIKRPVFRRLLKNSNAVRRPVVP